MALFGKKPAAKGKKTAPPPTKAADTPSPVDAGVAAAVRLKDIDIVYDDMSAPTAYIVPKAVADAVNEVVSRMGNAPDGATPQSHPHLFDEFGNSL